MVETRSSTRRKQPSAKLESTPLANISRKRKPLEPPVTAEKPGAKRQKDRPKTTTKTSTLKKASKGSPSDSTVVINRSPVLQLWAATVAQKLHPELSWSTSLSAGSAIATLCAISKGKSVGVIESKENDAKQAKKKNAEDNKFEKLDVMHFSLNTKNALVYVGTDPKPKPASEDTLKKKFGDRYEDVKDTFEVALSTWDSIDLDELNEDAFHMYEQFRPTVASGQGGWGRKGELNLDTVKDIVTKRS